MMKTIIFIRRIVQSMALVLLLSIPALNSQSSFNAVIVLDISELFLAQYNLNGPSIATIKMAIEQNIPVITTAALLSTLLYLSDPTIKILLKKIENIMIKSLLAYIPPTIIFEGNEKKEFIQLLKSQSSTLEQELKKKCEEAKTVINKITNNKEWTIYGSQTNVSSSKNQIDLYKDFIFIIPKTVDQKIIEATIDLDQLVLVKDIPKITNFSVEKMPLVNVDTLYSLLKKDGPIKKRFFLAGHGTPSKNPTTPFGAQTVENESGAEIAGLTYEQYSNFLKFLEEYNCEFLAIMSCFSGGFNRLIMHNFIKNDYEEKILNSGNQSFQPSFPIILTCLGDNVAFFDKEHVNFREFFKAIDIFVTEPMRTHFPTTSLEQIAKTMIGKTLLNQPCVLIPGSRRFFKPIETTTAVTSITYPNLLKYEVEHRGKPLVIPATCQTMLLYPSILTLPISIEISKQLPLIVSMIPGRGRHLIKEISIASKATLKETVSYLFIASYLMTKKELQEISLNESAHQITFDRLLQPGFLMSAQKLFIIQTLHLSNSTYNNVFVHRYYKKDSESLCVDLYYKEDKSYIKVDLIRSEEPILIPEIDAQKILKNIIKETQPAAGATFEATGGHETDVQFEKIITELFAEESTPLQLLQKLLITLKKKLQNLLGAVAHLQPLTH